MTVLIRQLHKHFVGEVSGVDLRKPLTKQEATDIEAGMDKYAVLVFHGQDITDEQQMAFALNFGEREHSRGGTVTKKEDYRLSSGLNDVGNLGKDGKPLAGAAKTSFMKKCTTDACETKAVGSDGKKLAGAAKTSFMKKCQSGA